MSRRSASGMLAAVLLTSAALAACSAMPKPVVLDADATGGVCRLKHDQQLEIRLPANPSTGYVWAIADGASMLLEPVGKPTYEATATAEPMVGSGGTMTFRFRPITMGHDTLRLVYRRPSEPDTAPTREFACDVMVWW